jgi:hypothetical protein
VLSDLELQIWAAAFAAMHVQNPGGAATAARDAVHAFRVEGASATKIYRASTPTPQELLAWVYENHRTPGT